MKKILSVLLAAVLVLGLVPAATAYTTADFSDVPSTHWAYDSVMRMADAGVIEGVGGGKFDPNGSVTAEQFITLVGRIIFPDIEVTGSDWSGPYVTEAKAKRLLTGTTVTDENLKSAIIRYDMAVILYRATTLMGVKTEKADSAKVTDYREVPLEYSDAVLRTYGTGLITGDENSNFNGEKNMRRAEAAIVIDRLLTLQKPIGNGVISGGNVTSPEGPVTPSEDWEYAFMRKYVPSPYDPDTVELKQGDELYIYRAFITPDAWGYRSNVYLRVGDTLQLTVDTVPAGYNYTKEDVQWSSNDESIAVVDENGLVTVVGEGVVWIEAKIPVIYYKNEWMTKMDHITLYCEGA